MVQLSGRQLNESLDRHLLRAHLAPGPGLPFHCRGHGFSPWLGTKIPHAAQQGQKVGKMGLGAGSAPVLLRLEGERASFES